MFNRRKPPVVGSKFDFVAYSIVHEWDAPTAFLENPSLLAPYRSVEHAIEELKKPEYDLVRMYVAQPVFASVHVGLQAHIWNQLFFEELIEYEGSKTTSLWKKLWNRMRK